MTDYAVGDLQGCRKPLECLLDQVRFDPASDRLWLVGDLVNRGPDSLGTLRLVRSLGSAALTVLGNHDLHCLAVCDGRRALKPSDTFGPLMAAPDRDELLEWLRHQPLVRVIDEQSKYVLVHAGIPPQWSLQQALSLSQEVEAVLQGDQAAAYFKELYGDQPNLWSEGLSGPARWRVITNYLTRMRFCDAHGRLDLQVTEGPEHAPRGMKPWFAHGARQAAGERIIFGHWAALKGQTGDANVCGLDTGCVWGAHLTLMRLGDEQCFTCSCA